LDLINIEDDARNHEYKIHDLYLPPKVIWSVK